MNQSNAATPLYNQAAAEAFAERIVGAVDAGALMVMVSIGHRTGLLDTMSEMPPAGADEIAQAAGLDARYVREWLAAMTTGGVVSYDPVRGRYSLPPEHAASLTRGAPLGNLAVAAQAIPVLGAVQERILDCFETGEGTRYEDYPCFHQMMAEDSGQTVVAQLFDVVLPLAPELSGRLEAGIDVLDAGCGSGRALIALAERYPASRFTGYDLCAEAVARAEQVARAAELDNLRFEQRDLTGFDEQARYDLVTSFDAVHDQKDPQGLIRSLHGALRQGGVYLMQDIAGSARLENNLEMPLATFLYSVSCLHCMPVSLGQGGAGLGTMWGWETAEAMLREAGFAEPERHMLPHDPTNVWFVARK
jgi:SAM-dependent methyltransferase